MMAIERSSESSNGRSVDIWNVTETCTHSTCIHSRCTIELPFLMIYNYTDSRVLIELRVRLRVLITRDVRSFSNDSTIATKPIHSIGYINVSLNVWLHINYYYASQYGTMYKSFVNWSAKQRASWNELHFVTCDRILSTDTFTMITRIALVNTFNYLYPLAFRLLSNQ